MTNIKAVVFDVDRTLLDTHQFIYQGFLHALQKHNLPLSLIDQIDMYMGISLEKTYEALVPNHSSADLAETHRSFQEKNMHLATPFPNTLQTLQTLKNAGIKIAAVTSRSKRTSGKTLELSGITPYLETFISQEDVSMHELKPHPRPVLIVLEYMNISPQDAIMVGDSKEDIEAGKRAGTKTVGVTYGSLGKKIIDSNPDFTIDDIADIISIIQTKQ